MTSTPSSRFPQFVAANIAYWQQRSSDLADEQIRHLNADHPNLLQAVALGQVYGQTQKAAAELALQLFPLIERCGHRQSWLPLLERAIAQTAAAEHALKFHLLKRLGQLFRLDRQLEAAITHHKEAERIAQEWGNEHALADAHLNLSEDYRYQRRYGKAEAHGLKALHTFSGRPEAKQWLSSTLNTLGLIAQEQGALETAESWLRQAAEVAEEVDPPTYLARMYGNLAFTLQKQCKFEEALHYYQEASALLETTASELDKIKLQLSLGSLYFEQGQLVTAEKVFRRAQQALLQQQGQIYYQAMAAQSLGNVLLKQERLPEAEASLQRSLLLWRQAGDTLMLANTLGTMGETLAAKKNLDDARGHYDEALSLLKAYPDNAWAQKLLQEFTSERAALDDSSRQTGK